MTIIKRMLAQSQGGVMSMEELDQEIAAVEVELAPEEGKVAEGEATPVEATAQELNIAEDPLDEAERSFDRELDETTTDGESVVDGIEVTDELEDLSATMEAMIAGGSVSFVEYASLSELATNTLARVGMESYTFAFEGIETPEGRLENLRLAQEGVADKAKEVKDAVVAGAKKMATKIGSLWDKFLALLGNRKKRIKVLQGKVRSLGEATKETVLINKQIDGVIGDDVVKTIDATAGAAEYVYGDLWPKIRDWSARKGDEPNVAQSKLGTAPGKPAIYFEKGRMRLDIDPMRGNAKDRKVASKGELQEILSHADRCLDQLRRAGRDFLSSRAKWGELLLGSQNVAPFSRGYDTMAKMATLYEHFAKCVMRCADYVERMCTGYSA